MSTIGFKGPLFFTLSALSVFDSRFFLYVSWSSIFIFSGIWLPGFKEFTRKSPIITDINVVDRYIKIVFPPILDSFLVSDSEATPKTKEANTNGTAMSFSKLINIVPKGAIQLVVNVLQPLDALITPYINPKTNPRMIFQCSASFFI